MSLESELLKLARNFDDNCESDTLISEMIKTCFKQLKTMLNDSSSDEYIISQFKKVNNTWNKVSNILQDEGIYLIKQNGFKGFCLIRKEFKNIF
jgi:hypothetical protein